MFGLVTSVAMVDVTKEYTFERMERDLKKLGREYPFLSVFPIGRSVLGRELYCAKWGCGETRVLVSGAHHGVEWITSLMLTRFLEDLCYGYRIDEKRSGVSLRDLYGRATFYLAPMVNPDGVNVSIKGLTREIPAAYAERLLQWNGGSADFSRTWRANARGVDLNHNYDAGFEEGKRAARALGVDGPGPTRYGGECAESEPETAALVRATRLFRPHAVVAYHAQGEEIYWDYNGASHPRAREIGERMARATGYRLAEPEGVAAYSGYKDWAIASLGIPAYTVEVGRGVNPIPIQQIETVLEENTRMLLHLVDWL